MKKDSTKVVNISKNKYKCRNATTRKIEEKLKSSSILIFNSICAVALKYESSLMDAPIITYKSRNVTASKLAAFNISLPMFKHKIASDIMTTLKTGNEIIREMYVPIAIMLRDVYDKTYDESLDFEKLLDDTIFFSNFKSKLKIEIGENLKYWIKDSDYVEIIERTRKDIISEFGLILPSIKTKYNPDLLPNEYAIKIADNVIGKGKVYPDKYMVLSVENPMNITFDIKEPAFELPAKWINENSKKDYKDVYTIVSPVTVIKVHLIKCIEDNLSDLLTRNCVYQLLEKLRIHNSEEYVDEILDKISIGKIQAVLANLLKENIPIKELEKILESISITTSKDKEDDIIPLTQKARKALSMTICERNLGSNGKINAITFAPEVEKTIANSISPDRKSLALEDEFLKGLLNNIDIKLIKSITKTNEKPVILCSSPIRFLFREIIEKTYPQIAVLSYNEILENIKVERLGEIEYPKTKRNDKCKQ